MVYNLTKLSTSFGDDSKCVRIICLFPGEYKNKERRCGNEL